ncbi:putative conserved membrane protein [Synechococcus sp. PROS-9-1]|nr:putative conserved membrane protein [Synechococcus sp. PROS-9-1]|tara:strand:- start:25 stop:141 length:117 start_codon:yes stop_codon:yes gene_type:complete
MTDYSVWIYAMLAVGALITAAVAYTLSQPSDLPYLKKK